MGCPDWFKMVISVGECRVDCHRSRVDSRVLRMQSLFALFELDFDGLVSKDTHPVRRLKGAPVISISKQNGDPEVVVMDGEPNVVALAGGRSARLRSRMNTVARTNVNQTDGNESVRFMANRALKEP